MRRFLIFCAAALLPLAAAQAQCLECAQQMMQGTLQSQAWSSIDQTQIDDTRQRDARGGVFYDANRHLDPRRRSRTTLSAAQLNARCETLSMRAVEPVLAAEFQRRRAAQGEAAARRWRSNAQRALGGQLGALSASYAVHARRAGVDDADRWMVSTARFVAERYVNRR